MSYAMDQHTCGYDATAAGHACRACRACRVLHGRFRGVSAGVSGAVAAAGRCSWNVSDEVALHIAANDSIAMPAAGRGGKGGVGGETLVRIARGDACMLVIMPGGNTSRRQHEL